LIKSYSKIYSFGHRMVLDIFNGNVIIQEKIDGSQFSIMVKNGQLYCRSHKNMVDIDRPPKLFLNGVATAKSLVGKLRDGWIYRGEYLQRPHHNTLSYDRIPEKHFILFDIDCGSDGYLTYDELVEEGRRLGLEVVPKFDVEIDNKDDFDKLLDNISILGGQKIEGVVVKNYDLFDPGGHVLMAKYVSDRFKEINQKRRNGNNPDIIGVIIDSLKTEARWDKAVIHLRESGQLEDDPRDIGPLLKELKKDVIEECEDYIKERLYQLAKKDILNGISRGFPEWYKEKLLSKQFEKSE